MSNHKDRSIDNGRVEDGNVFVSYCRQDKDYAGRLVDFLRAEGLSVFWDQDLPHGSRWHAELMQRIRSAAAFTVIMTTEADKSDNVHNEVGNALDTDRLTVFPLLLEGRRFDRLSELHYEDVTHGDMPGEAFVADLRATASGDPRHSASDFGPAIHQPDMTLDVGLGQYAKYVTSPPTKRAAELTGEARTLTDRFQFDEADAKLDEALGLAPDFVPALINRASLHCNMQHWDSALAAADRAAVLDPDQPFAHGNRAIALVGLKRMSEARTAIERTIALDPGSARNHWFHGGILADLGEFDLALRAYDRALEINPHLEPLKMARRMVVARKWASKIGIGRRRRS